MSARPCVLFLPFAICAVLTGCGTDEDGTSPSGGLGTGTETQALSAAWAEFSAENTSVYVDGDTVVLESNGWPDHASPYWSPDHPLYVEPTVTTHQQMAPGYIDDFQGSYTLTVPLSPAKATATTATGLGPIGIAVSGAMIYNDQEGGGDVLGGAVSGLDANGAHTGPQSYHYHLEPIAWSEDDDALIGVISDGFFLYGRKCASTGTYPADLDASGGHMATTQHNDAETYHYHIENIAYLGSYYLLFAGDYQGTPSAVR